MYAYKEHTKKKIPHHPTIYSLEFGSQFQLSGEIDTNHSSFRPSCSTSRENNFIKVKGGRCPLNALSRNKTASGCFVSTFERRAEAYNALSEVGQLFLACIENFSANPTLKQSDFRKAVASRLYAGVTPVTRSVYILPSFLPSFLQEL